MPAGARKGRSTADLDQVFEPFWLHELDTGKKDQRVLLVGRYASREGGLMYPLRIDLHTLEVSHFPVEMQCPRDRLSHMYYSRNGTLFESSIWDVRYWTGRDCHWKDEDGTKKRFLCRGQLAYGCHSLVPYRGWVHVPNSIWFRFDPVTLKEERLVPGRLPKKYTVWYAGVSGHYGLVAWSGSGTFYRVTVKESE